MENVNYYTKSADCLAKWLLGKVLCHKLKNGRVRRFRITETEAYTHDEKFCYGVDNKTGELRNNPKNKDSMFYSVGHLCDYASMLMISCGEAGIPDNVLIRDAACLSGDGSEMYTCITCLRGDFIAGEPIEDTDLLTSKEVWLEGIDLPVAKYCSHVRVRVPDMKKRRFCLQEDE